MILKPGYYWIDITPSASGPDLDDFGGLEDARLDVEARVDAVSRWESSTGGVEIVRTAQDKGAWSPEGSLLRAPTAWLLFEAKEEVDWPFMWARPTLTSKGERTYPSDTIKSPAPGDLPAGPIERTVKHVAWAAAIGLVAFAAIKFWPSKTGTYILEK